MENVHIAILVVLVSVLIVIGVCIWYKQRAENFDTVFNESLTSSEFLEYIDMGDHRTMIYSQHGNSGDTVLLLHNSPMNMNIWLPLYHTMQRISMSGAKTPNLISYDMRGHGTAWMPVDPKYNDRNIENYVWPLDLFVKDCKKVYDKIIGGGKIKICGFGFGGIVAQQFALTYPESISKLILLQTSIRPMPGLQEEIDYLSGPDGWIARNPRPTYLTSEEKFVEATLCSWFYLPKTSSCHPDTLVYDNDQVTDKNAPQYNLTASLWREGSSTTTLQVDKLLVSTNLVPNWVNAGNIPFVIHILAATDDPLAPPTLMANTYTTIYNNNRNVLVVFDVVNGRHGFTIMRPDYIAEILCDECIRVSDTDTNEGY